MKLETKEIKDDHEDDIENIKLVQQGRNNAPVKIPFFGQNLNNKKIKKIKKKCKLSFSKKMCLLHDFRI